MPSSTTNAQITFSGYLFGPYCVLGVARISRRCETSNNDNEFSKLGRRRDNSSSLIDFSGPELDAQLRKGIERRIEERKALFIHPIAFVGINPFLWLIWLHTGSAKMPLPLFATMPCSREKLGLMDADGARFSPAPRCPRGSSIAPGCLSGAQFLRNI